METYLLDVLESVHYEALQRNASQYFVIVHLELTDCVQTLDLGKQNEGVEIVV
mgnify:CR=1 FL=1